MQNSSLVGPFISLAALLISIEALKTNQASMKIAQRAYVTIANGKRARVPR